MSTSPESPTPDIWLVTSDTASLTDLLVAQEVGEERLRAYDISRIWGDTPEIDTAIAASKIRFARFFPEAVGNIGPYRIAAIQAGRLTLAKTANDHTRSVMFDLKAESPGPGEPLKVTKVSWGIERGEPMTVLERVSIEPLPADYTYARQAITGLHAVNQRIRYEHEL